MNQTKKKRPVLMTADGQLNTVEDFQSDLGTKIVRVPGLIYRVKSGKHHIVSRKDADLLLLGDQSISRKHAELYVADDNGEGGITIKDLNSKYGTFTMIGEGELTQLQPDQQITLKCGDCVRFGIQWNLWRVEFVPLLVAMSTLTQEEKTEVREMVNQLGGQVVNDWQTNCTYLTMNKITVTVKVVCALASGCPIVTPQYWSAFSQALSTMETTLPNTQDFMPPLAEAVLNPSEVSFTPDANRSTLFSGLSFVAASAKQLSRIRPMVTAAGGNAECFSTSSWSESRLLRDKTILMQHSANERQGSQQSQVPDGYIPVARRLRAQGVRCIPESEIGLSILHCSLSKYCNPRFNAQSLLSSVSSLEATQPINVICPDSEDSSRLLDANQPTSENRVENVNRVEKNVDQQQNSEDLFSSQLDKSTSKAKVTGKKSLSLSRRSSVANNETVQPAQVINPDPSLDMFAPSGSRTVPVQASNQRDIRPSCEDMFSSGSRKSKESKTKEIYDQPSTSKKLTIISEEEEDDFPTTSKKRARKPLETLEDDRDEFSFISSKKRKVTEETNCKNEDTFGITKKKAENPLKRNEDDDAFFTFAPCKKGKLEKENGSNEDIFSFKSNKSNKRNRQSDPDMFASSGASSNSGNPQKIQKMEDDDDFGFAEQRSSRKENDCFAFPAATAPKRKQTELKNCVKQEENVVIGLLSEKSKESSTADTNGFSSNSIEEHPEETSTTVYGKFNLIQVKKEVKEEELDELARELNNATIVMVKPLIVQKPKTVEAPRDSNEVNFKKFRKVNGLFKRTVPVIIGGNDLIPHVRDDSSTSGDIRPCSPHPVDDDDDDAWGFGNKKKCRIR